MSPARTRIEGRHAQADGLRREHLASGRSELVAVDGGPQNLGKHGYPVLASVCQRLSQAHGAARAGCDDRLVRDGGGQRFALILLQAAELGIQVVKLQSLYLAQCREYGIQIGRVAQKFVALAVAAGVEVRLQFQLASFEQAGEQRGVPDELLGLRGLDSIESQVTAGAIGEDLAGADFTGLLQVAIQEFPGQIVGLLHVSLVFLIEGVRVEETAAAVLLGKQRVVDSVVIQQLSKRLHVLRFQIGAVAARDQRVFGVLAEAQAAGFPQHPVSAHDIDLFHTVALVKVPEDVSFGFGEGGGDISFADDLDQLNFRELPAGTVLGYLHNGSSARLLAWDERGEPVSERFFKVEDDEIRLRVPAMPSMLTRDVRVIQQDCFCYLMERYDEHLKDAEG